MTSRARRRLLLGCLLLPGVLVLGDVVAWRSGEALLRNSFREWAAAQRAAGWTVTTGEPEAVGWPLTVGLDFPDFDVSAGDARFPGGLRWRSERLNLRVALLHPTQVAIAGVGRQRLTAGNLPELTFATARLVATLPLAGTSQPPPVQLLADHLRLELPLAVGGGSLSVGRLNLGLQQTPGALRGAVALSIGVEAEAISLRGGPPSRWPLGPQLASLSMDAAISGPVQDLTLQVPAVTAWRDGGGTLQISRLVLHWGPLDLSATASLALDAQLQPVGTADVQMTGQAAALDAMASNGAIRPPAALAAKAVLALIGTPPGDGEPAKVDMPLTLQNRMLLLGRIPLVRLPELAWPAPAAPGMIAQ